MINDAKRLLTQKTVEQTKLKRQLLDLTERRGEIGDSTYNEAVECSVLQTQINDIRSDMMQNRLGEYGLRRLNNELKNTRERSGW